MNEQLKLGLILMIVTIIAGGALALTNEYTSKQIEFQKQAAIDESLGKVIDADSFQEKEGYYEAYKDEKLVGKVIKVEASGYASIIKAMVGIDLENKITGIDILDHLETPGLGAKIEEPEFKQQFIDLSLDQVALKKDGGEIDAITGATITSRALSDAIRAALAAEVGAETSATSEYNETEDELDEEIENLIIEDDVEVEKMI